MTDATPAPAPAGLRFWWLKLPFRHMTVLVVFLFVVKEQFPFSNFPMYSNFDAEADVLYIADQSGRPIGMDAAFRTGSSTAKKAWKKEVARIVNPTKRDTRQATPEERKAAGAVVLGDWFANMHRDYLPPGTTAVRLYRRTFELKEGKLGDSTPELLAQKPL
ncbi:MAG: hypothetical protein K1X78_13975 [Verrucomicrobiaceae bacterium]|nr:hypothetical protein [Verrucomicrobiaceae bacterium]